MNRDARYAALLVLAAAFFLVFIAGWHGMPGGHSMPTAYALPAVDPGRVAPVPIAGEEFFPGFPIDLNTATREDLMILPGIGEKTADRVLALRAESGGFATVSDLLQVKWLGPARLKRLRHLVTVKLAPGAAGPEGPGLR
jgi:competence protein ComEA